jgi:hypothetical protein
MAGSIELKYIASVTPTVTNLQTLASSQSLIAGWFSNSVNNTSNVYLDYCYSGTFTTAGATRQVGNINIYVVAALNDTPTWPATASGTLGTEGAGGFTDTQMRDSLCVLLKSITVTATTSEIYAFPPTGIANLFGGSVPPYHCLFITANAGTTTTASFSSAAIYYTPTLAQYT